jgi:hypothetical protein
VGGCFLSSLHQSINQLSCLQSYQASSRRVTLVLVFVFSLQSTLHYHHDTPLLSRTQPTQLCHCLSHTTRRSLISSFESQLASKRLQHPQHQSTMSSSSSYGSYSQNKGAYTSRPSTSSTCMSSAPIKSAKRYDSNMLAAHSAASSSLYTNSGSSSRSKAYSKPIVHNGGGKINDPNTSTSAPNGGYYN